MSQLPTEWAEMSSNHDTARDNPGLVTELARTNEDEHRTPDSSALAQSPLKMLFVPSPLNVSRSSKASNQSMHIVEDQLSVSPLLPRSQTLPLLSNKPTNISSRRGFDLSLSSRFHELTRSISNAERKAADPIFHQNHVDVLVKEATRHQIIRSSSLGPLTPPHEVESMSWVPFTSTGQVQHISDGSTDGSAPAAANTSHSNGGAMAQAGDIVPSALDPFTSPSASGGPWLLRAFRAATQALDIHMPAPSTKVISQVLPVKAADQRAIKTYEIICDHLQHILPEPRYISITHALAVSPIHGVEDFPKSPPATPGYNGGDGYFGDQTIFTHAAEVAVHHEFRDTTTDLPPPPQRHIMSAEANLILLERYIPPTTVDEMSDFFSANSCRSYLADRLPELAVEYGSLLLVYPTRAGGQTFARRYVAPVLDPLLREMTILRNLNTNAAERLGRMRALDSMLDFGDMRNRLETFCTSMNARGSMKKSRSAFALTHSETTQVVLDRDVWMTWFVEQEQSRMKQDLVDYHKAGGRLPEGKGGKTDITPGMLTREIVEGLQKSTAAAGHSNIEVGIFVIRRVRRSTAG